MTARDPRLVEPQRVDSPPGAGAGAGADAAAGAGEAGAPYDPLRLCIFATVALLGWLLGPIALIGFAALGFVGYLRARRAGLLTSRCLLGDTRLVLVYLGALVAAGGAGVWWQWVR